MDTTGLIVSLLSGAVGGNLAGMLLKNKSLGTLGTPSWEFSEGASAAPFSARSECREPEFSRRSPVAESGSGTSADRRILEVDVREDGVTKEAARPSGRGAAPRINRSQAEERSPSRRAP